jgi:tetratricopeptide (TPR) repeat protein
MHPLKWIALALLALSALAPAAAQTRDQTACLAGADRDIMAICNRFVEETSRNIGVVMSAKAQPKDKARALYQLHNLRGGAYQAMARRYAADGDSQKGSELHLRAIEDFDQAIRLDPSQPHAFLNRGSSLAELSVLDRAIQDFEQVLRVDPKNALAFNNRGGAYGDKGDFARAIADLERAIALKPRYTDALVNRGSIHQQKKNYERAITDFDAALRYGARDVYVWSSRGRAWRTTGTTSAPRQTSRLRWPLRP